MDNIRKLYILAVMLLLPATQACGRMDSLKDISITSYSIKSVTPAGLKNLAIEVSLTIDNPSVQISISDISGVIYHKGSALVDFTADPITILASTESSYIVSIDAGLSSGVSILSVLSLVSAYDINDFTADINAKASLKGGLGKTYKLTDVPLTKFIRKGK